MSGNLGAWADASKAHPTDGRPVAAILEDGQIVIAYWRRDFGRGGAFATKTKVKSQKRYDHWCMLLVPTVTHWCPLPPMPVSPAKATPGGEQ